MSALQRPRSTILAGALALLVLPWALLTAKEAVRDSDPPPMPPQVQQLFNCRGVANGDGRLACFDREVAALEQAQATRAILFIDQASAQKARRGLFGFDLPDFGIFGGGKEDKVESVETSVESASVTRDGGYRITMADGSVWVQIDSKRMPLAPRPGQKIRIKSASFGSYFLSLEGRPSIRVRRER